jgi:hypothetical protein
MDQDIDNIDKMVVDDDASDICILHSKGYLKDAHLHYDSGARQN